MWRLKNQYEKLLRFRDKVSSPDNLAELTLETYGVLPEKEIELIQRETNFKQEYPPRDFNTIFLQANRLA